MAKPRSVSNAPTADLDAFLSSALLNPAQKEFCKDPERKIRLIAPAGNGKTHSLLWRCLAQSHLHGEGEPQRFLIFSFTRPAKDELLTRLHGDPQFRDLRNSVEVFTLNAWGYRRLKSRMARHKLLTTADERKNCMWFDLRPIWIKYPKVEYALTSGRRKSVAAKDLMDLSDEVKGLAFRHDLLLTYEDFLKYAKWLRKNGMEGNLIKICSELSKHEIVDDAYHFDRSMRQLFDNYFQFWAESAQWLYNSLKITYQDQKYWALIDVEANIKATRFTTGVHRFHHVMVDEFQDINALDLQLLIAIAKANKTSLCIIGDDDQAIYEWRGATPDFLLDPDKQIEKGYKTHVLEINYRSPKNIVDLSQKLIKHNKRRVDKDVVANSKEAASIVVHRSATLEDSVEFVKDLVCELLEDDSMKRIALIGRKRSQIIPYQIVFASEEIPFCAAEDLQIFLSSAFNELKELLTYKAQMETPAPFGPEPIQTLLKFCNKVKSWKVNTTESGRLRDYLASKRPRTILDALTCLYTYDGPLKGDNRGGSMSASFYNAIAAFFRANTVSESIDAISENFEGLQKNFSKSIDDIFYLEPPFAYLSEFAKKYGNDYGQFYIDIENAILTLAQTPSDDDDGPDVNWDRRLHLMTALRAKGKEFDAIVVLDCNQAIYPSRFADTEEKLEAERRLFYVAVTRAKQKLVFVVNKEMFDEPAIPTQFLAEMGLR